MYVEYGYYTETYGGTRIPSEGDFRKAGREAQDFIRYLTFPNGDIFADTAQADVVKGVVCAAAEACYEAEREQEQGGNVKSENKDGFSTSFTVPRKDGETVNEYRKRCMYQTVRPLLLPTGWLSRKARCKHDHKCGCCDCL